MTMRSTVFLDTVFRIGKGLVGVFTASLDTALAALSEADNTAAMIGLRTRAEGRGARRSGA